MGLHLRHAGRRARIGQRARFPWSIIQSLFSKKKRSSSPWLSLREKEKGGGMQHICTRWCPWRIHTGVPCYSVSIFQVCHFWEMLVLNCMEKKSFARRRCRQILLSHSILRPSFFFRPAFVTHHTCAYDLNPTIIINRAMVNWVCFCFFFFSFFFFFFFFFWGVKEPFYLGYGAATLAEPYRRQGINVPDLGSVLVELHLILIFY